MTDQSSEPRFHVVLIPGFGGFDALGQLEYYFGTTPVFQATNAGSRSVLHYFDNLPTAAVVTRASRLRRYLAKRIVRGEIREGDEVTLVGHSTGGLDIRQLISDLHRCPDEPNLVDGGVGVASRELRRYLHGVVFLSVPHWGTNIADWVRSYPIGTQAVIAKLRAAVAASQVPMLNVLEHFVTAGAASLVPADLLRAIEDALREADPVLGAAGPERLAEALESEAALALYLRHMSANFHVIDDLVSQRPPSSPFSPAHFSDFERVEELEHWDSSPAIETLSYVTISRSPFGFRRGYPAPVWDLSNPFTYPELTKDRELSRDTDLIYRACYRACAGGPFEMPPQSVRVDRCVGPSAHTKIQVWDNDGIVNTASMLWPRGENVLVECDHMDIVGHYRAIDADAGDARTFRAYDLLKSTPQFQPETFNELWREIFDFSAGGSHRVRRRAAATASR